MHLLSTKVKEECEDHSYDLTSEVKLEAEAVPINSAMVKCETEVSGAHEVHWLFLQLSTRMLFFSGTIFIYFSCSALCSRRDIKTHYSLLFVNIYSIAISCRRPRVNTLLITFLCPAEMGIDRFSGTRELG